MKLKWKRLCSATTCYTLCKRITFWANQKKVYHWTVIETRKIIIIELQGTHMKITKKKQGSQSFVLSWRKACWQIWNVSFWGLTAPLYQYLHQMLLWNTQWAEILLTRYFNFNLKNKKYKNYSILYFVFFSVPHNGIFPTSFQKVSRVSESPW